MSKFAYLPTCLLLWSVVSMGCYSPLIRENIECTDTGLCPSGQQCIDGFCNGPAGGGGGGGADAGTDSDLCSGSMTFDTIESFAIQNFSVPECAGNIVVQALGAQGGGCLVDPTIGGKGASITGSFIISGGISLKILVGESGAPGEYSLGDVDDFSQAGGTGGGGSFVVNALDNEPLIVAGGGGGATEGDPVVNPGGPGQVTQNAQDGGGLDGGNGGTSGAQDGGQTYIGDFAGYHGGTGGGGYNSDGVGSSTGDQVDFGVANQPGGSFISGGLGGNVGNDDTFGGDGGFGGGGSAGFTGGGGGGYSGGGAGGPALKSSAPHGGGGGGSFNRGENQENSSGQNAGDGKVVISWRS